MSGAINMLVRSFLQKQSLEECTLEELQALASEYPYSEAAQLLLAKKLYAAQATAPGIAEKYDEQLQKTLLLFPNPLWVQHLINEREVDGVKMVGVPDEERDFMPSEMQHSNDVQSAPEEMVSPVEELQAEAEEVPEPIQNNEEPVQHLQEPEEYIQEPEQVVQEPVHYHEPEQAQVMMTEEANDKPADLPLKEIEPTLGTGENDSPLTFEPFHTVDYFASQGIKYTPEEIPKDKFSQQLKSFTEWLKAMKRLPVSESDLPRDEVGGKQVEQLAQHSIEDREVVTETMAEVWVKQGNRLKAIEVYGKLSLLDPSKSSYFAAKIESLKIQ